MNRTNNYLALISAEIIQARRNTGAQSPQQFAEAYLQSHCNLPFSRMHEEIFSLLKEITVKRNARVAIAAPRGHAKSTIIALVYPLWCVLYGKESFVLIVSSTSDQAILRLNDIKKQLETNPLFLSDFPEVCRSKKQAPWRSNRILLANGAMISAYGAEQQLRGVKKGKDRPGLIICDDLENLEQVREEQQREKLKSWFTGTLMNAGHPATNFIVTGNVLHYDSLLANLLEPICNPGWIAKKYKAIEKFSDRPELWQQWSSIFRGLSEFEEETGPEAAKAYFEANCNTMLEGTQVLWPQRDDYHSLMAMLERDGTVTFYREQQNEPLDPDACIFREENFHYWDHKYENSPQLIQSLGKDARFSAACDPSLGKGKRSDYSAIILVAKDKRDGVHYVIAADIARRTPDQTIEKIIEYCRIYPIARFAFEKKQFQEIMLDNLIKRAQLAGVRFNSRPINSKTNKQARIAGLEALVTQGLIVFSRRHQILLEQLRQFPLGKHDDGPDALEMAIQVARYKAGSVYCYW
ncbi:MAG TPA: phage terminase large subunit [Sedimentisphaerales bacterium]|nr:phage terminase large subunit [Sedimentisphaerales bacterium]